MMSYKSKQGYSLTVRITFSPLLNLVKPHKTIPKTYWRADNEWDLGVSKDDLYRFLILITGLTVFGLGESMLVSSTLGNSPWVVLAEGVSNYSPFNIGEATFLISLIVLLLWIPLKQKPGFGTLMNILIIAAAIELGLYLFPSTNEISFQILYLIIGTALVGAGSALYLTCGLGAGPRDGLMTGLHDRTGVRVGRVRLGIEVSALSIGAIMGGTLGLGTAFYALFIGQSVAIFLGVVARHTSQ